MIYISKEYAIDKLGYENAAKQPSCDVEASCDIRDTRALKGLSPAPAAVCSSGETVCFETRDCYDGRLLSDGTTAPGGLHNPATGPLYVEGALPGDVLKVEVLKLETAETALMRSSDTDGAFSEITKLRETREFRLENGYVQFTDKLRLKLRPMIGVIGTFPAGEPVLTVTPHDHGGNMDCTEITEGSTVYLPVNVEGAMLAMGDLHALMGDGEVMICGMECAGKVTVRVEVIKGESIPIPAVVNSGNFYTVQSDKSLDLAARKASLAMHGFIKEHSDLNLFETSSLLSLKGNLTVCQIVDPLLTVRMGLELGILEDLGIKLP